MVLHEDTPVSRRPGKKVLEAFEAIKTLGAAAMGDTWVGPELGPQQAKVLAELLWDFTISVGRHSIILSVDGVTVELRHSDADVFGVLAPADLVGLIGDRTRGGEGRRDPASACQESLWIAKHRGLLTDSPFPVSDPRWFVVRDSFGSDDGAYDACAAMRLPFSSAVNVVLGGAPDEALGYAMDGLRNGVTDGETIRRGFAAGIPIEYLTAAEVGA